MNDQLLKIFRKVESNILLLDTTKQVHNYAKFLEKLCTLKRKLKGDVKILLAMPKKCKEPVTFIVLCTIGEYTFTYVMLDLGTSINLMLSLVYKLLKLGDLEPNSMIIQLANRSIAYPLCILDDVLAQVNDLIFPTDFYMLDMEDEETISKDQYLYVHVGTLTIEFGGNIVQFNIFEAMKHPTKNHSIFCLNVIKLLVDNYMYLHNEFPNSKFLDSKFPKFEFLNFANFTNFDYTYNGSNEYAICVEISIFIYANVVNVVDVTKVAAVQLPLVKTSTQTYETTTKAVEPTFLDVVKKKVIKLLTVGIVSPIQVVSKKFRMIVVKKYNNELAPTRVQSSWRVFIDDK
ncbi:hypothetical protein CR513_30843, partial [Mucuna pruriens]